MGNESVHTPNLDRLAAQSARFPNGYLTTSVCRPSLVTLMTGLYPHQHLVHFNHGPPGNADFNRIATAEEYVETRSPEFELIRRVPTLPRLLAEAGYRCLQTGKIWEGPWRNGGFTEGMTTFTGPPASQTYGGGRRLPGGEIVAHGNGDHGLAIGRETMEPIETFILDCEAEKTPWLVWYAPYLPHQPHDSPERYYDIAKQRPGVEPHELPYYASIVQFDETVGQRSGKHDLRLCRRQWLESVEEAREIAPRGIRPHQDEQARPLRRGSAQSHFDPMGRQGRARDPSRTRQQHRHRPDPAQGGGFWGDGTGGHAGCGFVRRPRP
jgi:arylsulfatase A-like enzyme